MLGRSKGEHWDLAVLPAPIDSLVGKAPPEATLIGEVVPGVFRADPFALNRGGRTTLLFERYDERAQRGEIWTAELGEGDRLEEERLALPLSCHASYPFLLEEGGEIFCVPETCLVGEVALYRAESFPDRWVKEAVLLRHARLADATVFRHEGRWWLACVSLDLDVGAATERLYLFHASQLTGPYAPHRGNPVRIDKRGARPAGTPFVRGGRLHRPGQDCTLIYGGGVVVYEVLELSPGAYREREVATLAGTAFGADGLHTLASAGNRTIIDLKNARGRRRSG